MPRLSVVVCTYDRYDVLPKCLKALNAQKLKRADYEILVVENTPPRKRKKINAKLCDAVILCDEPGLSIARNTGIERAKGDIIAFLDDDALVPPEWAQELVKTFDAHGDALGVDHSFYRSLCGKIHQLQRSELFGHCGR